MARPSADGKRTRTATKLKKEIENVLALPDGTLRQLLKRVSIVGGEATARPTRASLAARLGIPQEYDADFVLTQILGWLVLGSVTAWREGRPAWFSRAACLKICDAALHRAARRRILPRPGREVAVSEADRQRARSCAFVDHLALIEAEADDVEQAIEHYIQFGIERHRLVDDGDVFDVIGDLLLPDCTVHLTEHRNGWNVSVTRTGRAAVFHSEHRDPEVALRTAITAALAECGDLDHLDEHQCVRARPGRVGGRLRVGAAHPARLRASLPAGESIHHASPKRAEVR